MTRLFALLLTLLTGFTGLVYEVTWQKYLATLLGSDGEATAAVLAIFLGGLSLGYALFGRITRVRVRRARETDGRARLLSLYAGVEIGIGVFVLLFPSLFGAARVVSVAIPDVGVGAAFGFDLLLSALLIGPPAVLMGGTIPILTLALAGSREASTRVHAWIYGANTVGAFVGALSSAFFLIPSLGLDGVLYALGSLNIAAGIAFGLLDRAGQRVEPSYDALPDEPTTRGDSMGAYAAVALLGGFAMMALQTTFNRLGGLIFGSSHFTFGIVVAVFVLSIALGSFAVSAFKSIPRLVIAGSQWLLVILLVVLYQAADSSGYWAHYLRTLFSSVDTAFYVYHLASFVGILVVLMIPIGLAGALLPLLFHQLRGEADGLGSVAGKLYSWNTAGSLFGALVGGYVLLFWLDLDQVYRVAIASLVLAAALLTSLLYRVSWTSMGLLVVLPAVVGLALLPRWAPDRLAQGLYRSREPLQITYDGPKAFYDREVNHSLIFHRDGPIATVSVRERPRKNGRVNREIVNNGKSDGNLIGDYATMSLAALVPALLAEKNERAFVIGYGTGVTAGELAALDSVASVDVAEISRAVIDAAPYFEEGNLAASKSPKVTIKRSDAYRALMRSDGRFDIIVSEPSNPWMAGVEMLYSAEFLAAARDRLAPGGVYAQWFHAYEMNTETVELVMRTYTSVFPHVSVWYAQGPDLLLMGFDREDRALDASALEQRFERRDFRAAFARSGIDDFPSVLAHELLPLGTLHEFKLEGPVHTLRHPILSHQAARSFFVGGVAKVPRFVDRDTAGVGFRNSLLRRYAGRNRQALGAEILEAVARETCIRKRSFECSTLLARWRYDHPNSPALAALLKRLRREWPETSLIGEANLNGLSRLFGTGQLNELDQQTSLARAIRISMRFVNQYHYAVPFNRKILTAAWAQCAGQACDQAKEELAPILGSVGGAQVADRRTSRAQPTTR